MSRRGITLLEVLTVLAIIGLLLALLVPAVVSARESARRAQCQSNLRQFGIAIHAYHGDYGLFPPGNARGFSFLVPLLPYLDQAPLLTAPIPPSHYVGWPDDRTPKIQFLASHNLPFLACPSDPFVRPGSAIMPRGLPQHLTNYSANFGTGVQTYGYNGAFVNVAGGMFSTAGFTDGLSNTAAVSEILVAEPIDPQPRTFARSIWRTSPPLLAPSELDIFAHRCRATATDGVNLGVGHPPSGRGCIWSESDPGGTLYNHVLLPNDASCTNASKVQEGAYSVASLHAGGVNVLFADGHVRLVAGNIALPVWRAIGSRNGGDR